MPGQDKVWLTARLKLDLGGKHPVHFNFTLLPIAVVIRTGHPLFFPSFFFVCVCSKVCMS